MPDPRTLIVERFFKEKRIHVKDLQGGRIKLTIPQAETLVIVLQKAIESMK